MQAYFCFIKPKVMRKSILILVAFLLIISSGNAQLKRTWKRQIYGGLSKSLRSENHSPMDNYDMTFVSKYDWLFNGGFTYSRYKSKMDIPTMGGLNIASKPNTTFRQFNLSVGKRVDLSPKWGLSLYSGISYTHYSYPNIAQTNSSKYGVIYPISLSYVSASYVTKQSIGLHLNSELNFYLCDNIMMYVSYMHDYNDAHETEGFFLGGRFGLLKQKNGTRRLSVRANI
jgi:hypothetical protein